MQNQIACLKHSESLLMILCFLTDSRPNYHVNHDGSIRLYRSMIERIDGVLLTCERFTHKRTSHGTARMISIVIRIVKYQPAERVRLTHIPT